MGAHCSTNTVNNEKRKAKKLRVNYIEFIYETIMYIFVIK